MKSKKQQETKPPNSNPLNLDGKFTQLTDEALYFTGNDDRKSKDDFDYLKPDYDTYCFSNGILIMSQAMLDQMKYQRGRIPNSVVEQNSFRALMRETSKIFWKLHRDGTFDMKQKRPQQFYS